VKILLSMTSQLYEVFWSAGFSRGAKILRQPTKFLRNRVGNQAEENLENVPSWGTFRKVAVRRPDDWKEESVAGCEASFFVAENLVVAVIFSNGF